jgi:toxin-antitoxin system PIN domain toxin
LIAVDTNILVYSHRRDSPFHAVAVSRLRSLVEGSVPWAIPWACLHEFFAIVTHPKVYVPPSTRTEGVTQIEIWVRSPTVSLIGETDRHWSTLTGILAGGRVTGPLVYDARIAAICLEHGVRELWSADRDFSRFPQLKTVNPLTSPTAA